MSIPAEYLNALKRAIREEGPFIFATEEDAKYFEASCEGVKKESSLPPPTPTQAPLEMTPKEVLPFETATSLQKQERKSSLLPPTPTQAPLEMTPKEVLPFEKADSLQKLKKESSFPAPVLDHFESLKRILSNVAPEIPLFKDIPNDAIAKKLSETWKTQNDLAPISILSFQEPEEQKELLKQITKALDVYFGPAKLVSAEEIENQRRWDTFLFAPKLKMVITCDYSLWQLKNLMSYYKEVPSQGKRVLGKVPLFLLPDLSLYLKDAHLKRSLWKALVEACT